MIRRACDGVRVSWFIREGKNKDFFSEGVRIPPAQMSLLLTNFKIKYMQKFMLIVREDLTQLKRDGEPERFRRMRVMSAWAESLQESVNFLGGEPLEITRRWVTRDQVLSDGPFIEAKEGISGYIMINAENLEQAAAIAQGCPLVQQGLLIMEVSPILLNNGC
jgi:hypothetical protein